MEWRARHLSSEMCAGIDSSPVTREPIARMNCIRCIRYVSFHLCSHFYVPSVVLYCQSLFLLTRLFVYSAQDVGKERRISKANSIHYVEQKQF